MIRKKKESLTYLKKKLDNVYSQYIRLKYSKDGVVQCITCRIWKPIEHMQNGHYVSRVYLSTRYDDENCHPQCPVCNIFKHGNLDEYALFLVKKYGSGVLERLNKKKNQAKRITRLEYEMFTKIYRDKIRGLKSKRNT